MPTQQGRRREPRPAFQTYAADELSDATEMSLEEIGARLVLRSQAWREGSIPSDHAALARLLRVTVEKLAEIWPALEKSVEQGEPGRLIFPDLEKLRAEYEAHSQKQRDKINRRWERERANRNTAVPSTVQPRLYTPSSSSSSSVSPSPTTSSTTGGDGEAADQILAALTEHSDGKINTYCNEQSLQELAKHPVAEWITVASFVKRDGLGWMKDKPGVAYLLKNFDSLLRQAEQHDMRPRPKLFTDNVYADE